MFKNKLFSITIGRYRFNGPYKLATYKPEKKSGIYAIMHKEMKHYPNSSYIINYIGQTKDFSERGFPTGHHKFHCWLRRAGHTGNIYIALLNMPGSTELQRLFVESVLIKQVNPYCNG